MRTSRANSSNRRRCSSGLRSGVFFFGISFGHLFVSEPFALSATQGADSALFVVYAQSDSVIIPEVELCQVAVQVLLRAMLVDAVHAALEDAEDVLDGVGVHVAAHILIGAMVHRLVAGEVAQLLIVDGRIVGHDARFLRDVWH